MKIETIQTETLYLTEVKALDPITAVFIDKGEGRGRIIIECFGDCWSAYWGSMGMPLKEFFIKCGSDYLENAFIGRFHKMTKPQKSYLCRIIEAVQQSLTNPAKAEL